MTTTTIESQIGEMREQIGQLREQIGELRGEFNGLSRRMDDMHRLMMVMIGVAGGGLVSGIVGVILQLVK